MPSTKSPGSPIAKDLNVFAQRSANFWPGEFYRLLAALCKVLPVRHAIEIGDTYGTECSVDVRTRSESGSYSVISSAEA